MGNVNKKPKGQARRDPARDPKYKAMVAAAAKRRAEEPPPVAQSHGGLIQRYQRGRLAIPAKGGKRRTRRKRRHTRTHKRRRHRRSHKRRRRHKRRTRR